MQSILDDLWYGAINAQQYECHNISRKKNLLELIHHNREELYGRLDEKGKETLEKYDDCYTELESYREREIFVRGFRLGMQLAVAGLSADS